MKHKLLITGAAGYVGTMLCDHFESREDVEIVIGLDKDPMPDFLKGRQKILWIQANTAESDWIDSVRGYAPDIIIHTAWQIRALYGKKKLVWNWNINGSEQVFDFVFSLSSVKKLIYFSSIACYGAEPSNTFDRYFCEHDPLRKSAYGYAEQKRIVEERLKEKYQLAKERGTSVQVAVIRPGSITGPRGRYMRMKFGLQSALTGQLKGGLLYSLISVLASVVPVTPKWCRQFVHEDDIVDIVAILAFGKLKTPYEVFNASPPGPVITGPDIAEAVGKQALCLSPGFIRLVFFAIWHGTLGRIPTSPGSWRCYSYPIPVDGSKITSMYGFRYAFGSKDAFVKKEGRYMRYLPELQTEIKQTTLEMAVEDSLPVLSAQ